MRKLLISFLITIIGLPSMGQQKIGDRVTLKEVLGKDSWFQDILSPIRIPDPKDYTIPSDYGQYRVAAVILNRAQGLYEDFINKKISFEKYQNDIELYHFDTTSLYHGELRGNRINVFTAIDSLHKYVIVDADNNKNFLDDSLFTFSLKNQNVVMPEFRVTISKYTSKEEQFTVPVLLDAFDSRYGETELERSLEVSLIGGSMNLGEILVGKETYLVGLANQRFGLHANKGDYRLNIRKKPFDNDAINYFNYSPKDEIDIGGNLYLVKQRSTGSLVLEFLRKSMNEGGGLNTLAPPIAMRDIIYDKPYELNTKSGNYTLIDFWGSWCAPCIDALPLLTDSFRKYQNKNVSFVSVAMDYERSVEKLKEIISKYDLDWPQLWVNRNALKGSPIMTYKVDAFPTTIVLDTNGRIVYRGTGSEGLKKAIEIIDRSLLSLE